MYFVLSPQLSLKKCYFRARAAKSAVRRHGTNKAAQAYKHHQRCTSGPNSERCAEQAAESKKASSPKQAEQCEQCNESLSVLAAQGLSKQSSEQSNAKQRHSKQHRTTHCAHHAILNRRSAKQRKARCCKSQRNAKSACKQCNASRLPPFAHYLSRSLREKEIPRLETPSETGTDTLRQCHLRRRLAPEPQEKPTMATGRPGALLPTSSMTSSRSSRGSRGKLRTSKWEPRMKLGCQA